MAILTNTQYTHKMKGAVTTISVLVGWNEVKIFAGMTVNPPGTSETQVTAARNWIRGDRVVIYSRDSDGAVFGEPESDFELLTA